jgi:hypothetical protein
VLSKPHFIAFLKKFNIKMERVDFPQHKILDDSSKTKNAKIAETYKFNGAFPTVLLIETTTRKALKIPYSTENVSTYIALIKSKITSQ